MIRKIGRPTQIMISAYFLWLFFPLANANTVNEQVSIEKITVTSTKRDIAITDVSGSVSVITQKELESTGADSLQDIVNLSPNVTLFQPIKNRSTITIRGINTDVGETQLTQDPVGVYLDDTLVTGSYAETLQPDMSLYDINRVEVLRGPQGTFFGSGNLGGAIRIISNEPNLNALSGSGRIDLAHVSSAGLQQRYDGMLNVPLIQDRLALRVVASKRKSEGWIENVRLNTRNDFVDTNFRASLKWLATDKLEVRLTAMDIESTPEAADSYQPALGLFKRSSTINEGRKFDLQLNTLNVRYKLNENSQFISTTSQRKSQSNWVFDIGPFGDIGQLINQSPIANDSVTQEFRLASSYDSNYEWILGAYYYSSQLETPFVLSVIGLQDFVNAIIPNQLDSDLFNSAPVTYEMNEKAVFGDITLPIDENWQASIGLRWFTTDASYQQGFSRAFDFATFSLADLPGFTNQHDDRDWMWRAVLAYKPDANKHLYASLSKGVRAGQINPNIGASVIDPSDVIIAAEYQSDSLYSAQLGAKITWLDDKLHTDLALFYSDWRDVQTDALRLSDRRNYIANAGNATAKGIELDLKAILGQGTQLYWSIVWQNAEVDSISDQFSLLSGAVENDSLPGAPEIISNFGVSSRWQTSADLSIVARADFRYVSESVNRFTNLSGFTQPNPDYATNSSYQTVNASIEFDIVSWKFTLYGHNLTNNDDVILNIGNTVSNPAVSLKPRTIGARVAAAF